MRKHLLTESSLPAIGEGQDMTAALESHVNTNVVREYRHNRPHSISLVLFGSPAERQDFMSDTDGLPRGADSWTDGAYRVAQFDKGTDGNYQLRHVQSRAGVKLGRGADGGVYHLGGISPRRDSVVQARNSIYRREHTSTSTRALGGSGTGGQRGTGSYLRPVPGSRPVGSGPGRRPSSPSRPRPRSPTRPRPRSPTRRGSRRRHS